MTIRSELEALYDSGKGKLDVKDVERWARKHRGSELHAALTWDDETAGHLYRLDQIRRLISLHIVRADGLRQTVSLSIDRMDGGGYRPRDTVLAAPVMRAVLLTDAIAEFERLAARFRDLSELQPIFDAIQRVAAKYDGPFRDVA